MYIRNVCNKLSDRDKKIFVKKLLGHTQETIAAEVNMSQAHVARIFKKCKLCVIKELDDAGYHDTAKKLLLQLFKTTDINDSNILNAMKKYHITLKDREHIVIKQVSDNAVKKRNQSIKADKYHVIKSGNNNDNVLLLIIQLIKQFKKDNLSMKF
jgi:DNA-directed RNA polymerase specialized sigma subunit